MISSTSNGYMLAKQRLTVSRLAYDAGDFHAALRNIRLVLTYLVEKPSIFAMSEWAFTHHLAGKIYLALKMLQEAREQFCQASTLRTGEEEAAKLSDMRYLAECCRHEKKFTESENIFKECISMCRDGRVSPIDYAKSAMGLARLYIDYDRLAEAQATLAGCLEHLDRCGLPARFWYGRCLLTQARLEYAQGKLEESEQTLRRGLSIIEPLVGPTHPVCTRSLKALGQLQLLNGKTTCGKNQLAEVRELIRILNDHDH